MITPDLKGFKEKCRRTFGLRQKSVKISHYLQATGA
jgi:hypothetical protein